MALKQLYQKILQQRYLLSLLFIRGLKRGRKGDWIVYTKNLKWSLEHMETQLRCLLRQEQMYHFQKTELPARSRVSRSVSLQAEKTQTDVHLVHLPAFLLCLCFWTSLTAAGLEERMLTGSLGWGVDKYLTTAVFTHQLSLILAPLSSPSRVSASSPLPCHQPHSGKIFPNK